MKRFFVAGLILVACSTSPETPADSSSDTALPWQLKDVQDMTQTELPAVPADATVGDLPESNDIVVVPEFCQSSQLGCGGWQDGDQEPVFCGNCSGGQWCTPQGACESTPVCGPGGLSGGSRIDFGGPEDADWSPQPGEPFAGTVSLLLANPEACPWCHRSVLIGRPGDDGPWDVTCVDVGPIDACGPGTAAELPLDFAQASPGETLLLTPTPPKMTCADDWSGVAMGTTYDTAAVAIDLAGEACVRSCDDRQCGVVGESCGMALSCGHCPPGHVCEDHQCEVAAPCALDELNITDVLLDGFKQDAEVNPGEDVPIIFSWTLSAADDGEELPRQLVVGHGTTAGFCVDVGYMQTCPSMSAGLATGALDAPMIPGVYPLEVAAIAAETCAEARAEFASAWPRQTIGSLAVVGNCAPLSCAQLDADCGWQSDGCGGLLDCGRCKPGVFCQSGGCAADPSCAEDIFEPIHLNLMGKGNKVSVERDRFVSFSLSLAAATGDCPTCTRLAAVAVGETVVHCVELTDIPACPEYYATGIGALFFPPQAPGDYPVSAALIMEDDCADAQATFADYAPVTVGTLHVKGECTPFGCADLNKECGTWGDGCGGFLHCGQCEDEETCSMAGICENQCTHGLFNILGLSINGSGSVASSPPDKSVQVSLGYELGNAEDCPNCAVQLVFGIDNEAMQCEAIGALDACPEFSSGDLVTHVTAPSKPGIYAIYALMSNAGSCNEAKGEFVANTNRKKLGTLHVTDGCTPKSCLTMGKQCGKWEDGCGNTLSCGTCQPTDLCNAMGGCYCSAGDPYEPNNSADKAYDFGDKTDNDALSHVTINAAVDGEADWYRMGSTDKQWAYMEPFVQVTPGNAAGFKTLVAYRCLDGSWPTSYNELQVAGCDEVNNLTIPGLGSVSSAWECTPMDGIITIHFGPHCSLLDDSGELFVSVSNTGSCSAYELDLHL